MGNKKNNNKKFFNSEVILTLIVSVITVSFLLILALVKVHTNATEYRGNMRVPNVEAPTAIDIAREPELITCAEDEKEGEPLTKRQLIMQKSGLEPDESIVNWVLTESISSYVEYSVGINANAFAGYDFNEVQQLTAKRIKNTLDSSLSPGTFCNFVIQDSGEKAWEYVCVNHGRTTERTMINVLKVLYLKDDYGIPDNVYFQNTFRYSEEGETESNDVTVNDPYQAFDLVCEQGLSDTLYPFSSYVFLDSNGVKQLLIFCGSFDNV